MAEVGCACTIRNAGQFGRPLANNWPCQDLDQTEGNSYRPSGRSIWGHYLSYDAGSRPRRTRRKQSMEDRRPGTFHQLNRDASLCAHAVSGSLILSDFCNFAVFFFLIFVSLKSFQSLMELSYFLSLFTLTNLVFLFDNS